MTDYKKIDKADIEVLQGIVGRDRVFLGDDINEDYSHDAMEGVYGLPEAVVKVETTQEVAAIMKHANANKIPVVVRGAGSGLVGAAVPTQGGMVIDMTLMNKIVELDGNNLTVTVQAGVFLGDIARFVEEHDLFYPPDPGEKEATIAGNISTNAGGMRAVKYGVTRDYVRGLTIVTPEGEIMELGGKVVKNSAGYGIKDLVIGSEGTLCIITEAILKLLPLPKESVSLLVPFDTIDEAIGTVPKIIRAKVIPTAIEFIERDILHFAEEYLGRKFIDTRYNSYLLLTFDGNTKDQVEREYEIVAKLCMDQGGKDAYRIDTDERKEAVWTVRGALLDGVKASTSQIDECDVVVPRDKVAEFINFTNSVAEEVGIRIFSFGHAGDGNLHIDICRDELDQKTWEDKLERAFQLMYKKSDQMGGLVSGEHGIGHAKRKYMLSQYGSQQVELMKRIKKAFDPNNIMNPGKVCQ